MFIGLSAYRVQGLVFIWHTVSFFFFFFFLFFWPHLFPSARKAHIGRCKRVPKGLQANDPPVADTRMGKCGFGFRL